MRHICQACTDPRFEKTNYTCDDCADHRMAHARTCTAYLLLCSLCGNKSDCARSDTVCCPRLLRACVLHSCIAVCTPAVAAGAHLCCSRHASTRLQAACRSWSTSLVLVPDSMAQTSALPSVRTLRTIACTTQFLGKLHAAWKYVIITRCTVRNSVRQNAMSSRVSVPCVAAASFSPWYCTDTSSIVCTHHRNNAILTCSIVKHPGFSRNVAAPHGHIDSLLCVFVHYTHMKRSYSTLSLAPRRRTSCLSETLAPRILPCRVQHPARASHVQVGNDLPTSVIEARARCDNRELSSRTCRAAFKSHQG